MKTIGEILRKLIIPIVAVVFLAAVPTRIGHAEEYSIEVQGTMPESYSGDAQLDVANHTMLEAWPIESGENSPEPLLEQVTDPVTEPALTDLCGPGETIPRPEVPFIWTPLRMPDESWNIYWKKLTDPFMPNVVPDNPDPNMPSYHPDIPNIPQC